MSSNVYAPPKSSVELATKECEECGEAINKKAEICPKCGVRQKKGVNKTALLLLTFFLGGLGAHKFYLRKPWWGVLYLAFFWTYIPGLVALVEFIVYACTDSERLNEKYESAGGASTAIIVVVAAIGVVAVIGILAAIALPQYHDYTMRARTAQAIQSAEPLRAEVEQYAVKNGRLPDAASDLSTEVRTVPNIALIRLEERGLIRIEFLSNLHPIGGQTVELVPAIVDGHLSWNCSGGTVAARLRPTQCRS